MNLVLRFLLLPAFCSTLYAEPKPNILVFFTDDHGYADLGCQGLRTDVKTPHIDALAAAGVRMTNGYVTAPQCSPSRCGLITGQYQQRFGMEDNGSFKIDPASLERFWALKNLPRRLQDAGYATGLAGKSHLGSDDSAELGKLGFDKAFFKHSNGPGHWNMDLTGKDLEPQVQKGGDYHLEQIATFACAFIERFKAQPFFFYLAFRAPHVPLDAPKKYLDRFPGDMPETRRKALGAISAVDDGIGRIVETLQKNGLEKNTLIFLIGDNGAPIGLTKSEGKWDGSLNDPLNGEKGMLTEGGIRTPFVVSWKGTIAGGQVYQHPVISLDVAATAVAAASIADRSQLDGVNLLPYLTGQDTGRPHDALYWRWNGQYAIRQGDMKYLTSGDRHYLFDLATDPEEKRNLHAQQPELATRLRSELEKWSQGLIPPGIGREEMTRPAQRFFDFYLDGKREAVSESKDASPTKPKSKRRARKKAAAKPSDIKL